MDINSTSPITKIPTPTVRDILWQPRKTERAEENDLSKGIKFEVDKETGEIIVKVLDNSGKIIRVIPIERMADILRSENSMGSIIDKTL